MADAYAIWRAADGSSKQKSVRMFWPELADALGGTGEAGAATEGGWQQPKCARCNTQWARGTLKDGTAVCATCYGHLPEAGRIGARHHPEWPKTGAVK